jgi:hypothetical protein
MTELPPLSPRMREIVERESSSYDALIHEGEADRALGKLLQGTSARTRLSDQEQERGARAVVPWYFTWKLAAALAALGALGALLLLLRKPVTIVADIPDAQTPVLVQGSSASTSGSASALVVTTATAKGTATSTSARPRPRIVAPMAPATGTAVRPIGTAMPTGQR